jgi:hypothetical protein
MFCLRSWGLLLFFLYPTPVIVLSCCSRTDLDFRTNASPIYILLYLVGTYVGNGEEGFQHPTLTRDRP